ncbi:5-hydroxytryptamine receptor 2a [Plakobranchus ocellatus]|uniref:5-hydroxytryptamine receptor 2a n=1 Tax=Plakobranchus ocellatus TaxID=259542 RepID=A0AAV4CVE9_9GAST|nr:5-hydroxytryptamine receptor 2a [Plakobranchus ocellatus]
MGSNSQPSGPSPAVSSPSSIYLSPNISSSSFSSSPSDLMDSNLTVFGDSGQIGHMTGTHMTGSGSDYVQPLNWGMLGLTLIIVCTAVGNLLVCLAVCWEKRLQNMTNYFLMSLAIADFLVSLLVMPLGMVVEMFAPTQQDDLRPLGLLKTRASCGARTRAIKAKAP